MSKWQQIKLGDIVYIKTGKLDSNAAETNGIYPFFTCDPQTLRINTWAYDQEAVLLAGNNASGNYSAKYYRGRFNAYQRTYIISSKSDTILLNRFLAYALNLKLQYLKNISSGATTKFLTLSMLNNLSINLPPIEIQRKIADVLSVYDDLIENNRKQIKLLEEAAQRLYKEWFIDLRFPGHETTKIINGIPDVWERKKLIEIADIQYGYAFDGSLFNSAGKGTPIVRIRNIPTGTTEDYTTESADSQYLVKEGDILVGMDGEFHINTWCGESAYLVQRTCRIMPKNADMRGFLLLAIYDPIKFFEKTVVGATVAHLGKKHLDTIVLTIPTPDLYSQFQEFFFKRQNLMIQNRKLAEARDRLLPKLMNGELIETRNSLLTKLTNITFK